MDQPSPYPQIVNVMDGEWSNHPRFAGVQMKRLLSRSDNEFANVNLVRVPLDSEVGWHNHQTQVETVYILKGEALLTVGDQQSEMPPGSIVAIPVGIQHCLRCAGSEPVELLAFFTPPIG